MPPEWQQIRVKLGDLKPWPMNPRQSTKKQAARLLASFDEFGQVQTVAVGPDLEVYDGHQRLSALLTVHGPDYEIDARQSSRPLTDAERRKLVAWLHAGAVGSWDWDALSGWDAGELIDWGFDSGTLADWKRDVSALDNLLESEKPEPADAEPDIDRAEVLREKWGTERGQLWRIGEHRLLCGDSTVREDVERVMGGEVASLAPVDPPYNVGIEYDGETVDDKKDWSDYEAFTRAWFSLCQSVSINQIVTPGRRNIERWCRYFESKSLGAWTKNNAINRGKISMFACWEPIFFYGDKWKRERGNDLFDYPVSSQKDIHGHPCPKPLPMWEDLIEHYSEEGDAIYEAFAGSGTTLVACENLGRKCRAIEISPAYCAVILERMATAFPEIEIELLDS